MNIKDELLLNDPAFKRIYFDNKRNVLKRVGEMVLRERMRFGMTQKQLAQKLGTRQSDIARIERGNSNISLKRLDNIAQIFDTDLLPPCFVSALEAENIINKEVFGGNNTYIVNVQVTQSIRKRGLSNLISPFRDKAFAG